VGIGAVEWISCRRRSSGPIDVGGVERSYGYGKYGQTTMPGPYAQIRYLCTERWRDGEGSKERGVWDKVDSLAFRVDSLADARVPVGWR
jgi:hypothetical protein